MKQIRDIINDFKIENANMTIICDKYNIVMPIQNGSVIMNIVNEEKIAIGINELNKNDNIIVFYREENNNKCIKPIKIIKLYSYIFNSDTDDDIII